MPISARARSGPQTDGFRDPAWPAGLTRRKNHYRFRRMIKGRCISISLGDMSERQAIERAEELNLQHAAGVDILRDDARQASLLLRRILGKVEAHEIRLPGKKRGYARLRFRFNGWKVAQEALRNSAARALLAKGDPEVESAVREVVLDLGSPSRMDEWAPKIDRMRKEKVPWNEIGRATGLGVGNNAGTAH